LLEVVFRTRKSAFSLSQTSTPSICPSLAVLRTYQGYQIKAATKSWGTFAECCPLVIGGMAIENGPYIVFAIKNADFSMYVP